MIIGYLYLFNDGSMQEVIIKAALNKLIEASNTVLNRQEEIIGRWTVKRKV